MLSFVPPRHQSTALDAEVRRDLRQLRDALLHPNAEARALVLDHVLEHATPQVRRALVAELIRRWRQSSPLQQPVVVEVLRALNPAAVNALKLDLMVARKATRRAELIALLGLVSPVGDVRVLVGLCDLHDSAAEHADVRAAAGQALTQVSPVPPAQLDEWLEANAADGGERLLVIERALRLAAAPDAACSHVPERDAAPGAARNE